MYIALQKIAKFQIISLWNFYSTILKFYFVGCKYLKFIFIFYFHTSRPFIGGKSGSIWHSTVEDITFSFTHLNPMAWSPHPYTQHKLFMSSYLLQRLWCVMGGATLHSKHFFVPTVLHNEKFRVICFIRFLLYCRGPVSMYMHACLLAWSVRMKLHSKWKTYFHHFLIYLPNSLVWSPRLTPPMIMVYFTS